MAVQRSLASESWASARKHCRTRWWCSVRREEKSVSVEKGSWCERAPALVTHLGDDCISQSRAARAACQRIEGDAADAPQDVERV